MKKSEKLSATKEKILLAADKLMQECEEPAEVTSRAIANQAGVQLAMINYCFGSRDELFYEVFRSKEKEYQNDPKFLQIINSSLSPKEKLRQFHYIVADFLIHQYKFTKAITGYVLLNRDLSVGLHSLPFVLEHYKGSRTEQECKIISYELSSVMQLAIYRYQDIFQFSGYDLTNEEELHQYIDLQLDLFLKEE